MLPSDQVILMGKWFQKNKAQLGGLTASWLLMTFQWSILAASGLSKGHQGVAMQLWACH